MRRLILCHLVVNTTFGISLDNLGDDFINSADFLVQEEESDGVIDFGPDGSLVMVESGSSSSFLQRNETTPSSGSAVPAPSTEPPESETPAGRVAPNDTNAGTFKQLTPQEDQLRDEKNKTSPDSDKS